MYQKNRSPTSRLQGKTPHEAWTGEKPYLGHMRIIGCVAWVHIPKEKRKKLDERSRKCYLVGYEGVNIFRVWNPASHRVERVTHIDFDETRLITTATSDTGYWMAEATGDDVFDAGSDEDHLHSSSDTPDTPIVDAPVVDENIQRILTPRDPGDVGVEFNESNEDVGDDDAEELVSGPELHPSPSQDATYSQQRPKRIPAPSQKAILNDRWKDSHI